MKNRTTDHRERLDAHVFVCTNSRESHDNCGDAGAQAVVEATKQWLRDRDAFWSTVSVAETSCLGLCSADGTAISIQPHNVWYSDVTPEAVPTLLQSVFGADAQQVAATDDLGSADATSTGSESASAETQSTTEP